MVKTLLKKQMMEILNTFLRKGAGKRKSSGKGTSVLFGLLFIYLAGMMGFLFYQMAGFLCEPLIQVHLGWMYFALMALIATTLGVVGSIFTASSALYQAKDNELLLSMPISPATILFVRMTGIYLITFLFEAIVMVPAEMVYFTVTGISVQPLLCGILILFLLPLFAVTLSCVLGWMVAWIHTRMRRKNLVTMVLSLGFLAVYFYLYMNASTYLQMILVSSAEVSEKLKIYLYPLYQMGLAAEGSLFALLIFSGMLLLLFGIVYYILFRTFLNITTGNRGAAKIRYREKKMNARSVRCALLWKEWKRLTGSVSYMLNCCLGIFMLLIGAVVILIKGDALMSMAEMIPGISDVLPLLACLAVNIMICINYITAPSVSLEGKNLWLLQSMPITGWQVLKAKLGLHIIVNLIPAMLAIICMDMVIRPNVMMLILIPVFTVVFIIFNAAYGLMLNLKKPNLDWNSEAVVVKQSMSVFIALFSTWIILIVLTVFYLLLSQWICAEIYLLLCTLLMGGISVLLLRWIQKRGSLIFEQL
ncbi:MAG: hypothetical protein ACI4JQ_05410 [Ruminococcus sp.]